MCWISYTKPELQIAKEDIPVFKIVWTDNISYFSNFKYCKDIIYSQELNLEKGFISMCGIHGKKLIEHSLPVYKVFEGFHSYSYDCEINLSSTNNIIVYYKGINLGIYPKYRGNQVMARTVKFVIPKSSVYYLNDKGEYVSNQIKLIE